MIKITKQQLYWMKTFLNKCLNFQIQNLFNFSSEADAEEKFLYICEHITKKDSDKIHFFIWKILNEKQRNTLIQSLTAYPN